MLIEQFLDLDKFTASERTVVEFISDHPDIVIKLSLEELSNECFVSQASIIRLCKKLGTKGYGDFKIRLASEINSFIVENRNISVDIPIAPNSSINNIADTFYQLSTQALKKTMDNMDFVTLSKAANLLALSDIVHIYGRGESLILAEDFQYKLMRIGKHCHLEPLNGFTENLNRQPVSSRMKECALVISQYCNSQQIHYIIDELMLAKIPFVLLTAAKDIWPYDKYAEVVLRIDCDEKRNKMGCFASRTSFLYVLDCIYGIIFSKHYEQNKQYLIERAKQKTERNYYYHLFQNPKE